MIIDYTILKPEATTSEVFQACEKAVANGYASICINPAFIRAVRRYFPNLKVCSVVDFPYGASGTYKKHSQMIDCIHSGCHEVDVVAPLGLFRESPTEFAKEIKFLVNIAHNNNERVIVKIIVEACLWNDQQLKDLIRICDEAGAEYIKTSTGVHRLSSNLTPQAKFDALCHWIDLWHKEREEHGYQIKLKASGGVRNREQVKKLIELGADRIGTSSVI